MKIEEKEKGEKERAVAGEGGVHTARSRRIPEDEDQKGIRSAFLKFCPDQKYPEFLIRYKVFFLLKKKNYGR